MTVLQTSTATERNRYPEIFDEAARLYPDAKSILSYGCSTGEELETLSVRWPEATISGVDILPSVRENASRRFPHLRITSPDRLAGERFDIISAMSVLCRWPEISGPLPFPLFAQAVRFIDEHLAAGGLLVVFNTTYNPAAVLTGYSAFRFQPRLKLPHNSRSRLIVTPRNPDGSVAKEPHPVIFRKPRDTARHSEAAHMSWSERGDRTSSGVAKLCEPWADDREHLHKRFTQEINHVLSSTPEEDRWPDPIRWSGFGLNA